MVQKCSEALISGVKALLRAVYVRSKLGAPELGLVARRGILEGEIVVLTWVGDDSRDGCEGFGVPVV